VLKKLRNTKRVAQRAATKAKTGSKNNPPTAIVACSYAKASTITSAAANRLLGKLSHTRKNRVIATQNRIRAKTSSVKLRHFDKSEIFLTPDEAWYVLRFFFKKVGFPRVHPQRRLPCHYILEGEYGGVRYEDVQFAQALLVEAMDASFKLSILERLGRSVAKGGPIKSIMKRVGKEALKIFAEEKLKEWFPHMEKKDLKNPKIYMLVRDRLANGGGFGKAGWHKAWQHRVANCQPILEYSE
jgi:hypothetical protein